MSKLNFDNHLFHPSGFSKLVTQPKSKADKDAGLMSATARQYLREIFIEERYGRKKEITTKQMEKGIIQEEAAITVYCKFKKKFYKKNDERITNEYLTGEPDLSDNEDVMKTVNGVDIKCSWSIFTFPDPDEKLDPSYEWQNQGYMCLIPCAETWTTAYVLVNAPAHLITDEKRYLFSRMLKSDPDMDVSDPEYIAKCVEIEKSMIFDMPQFKKDYPNYDLDIKLKDWKFDIPLEERVVEFVSFRNSEKIDLIPPTAIASRVFLNSKIKR